MSEHEKNSLMDCLFSGQDMKLRNIKFFRGSRDLISPQELRAEAHSALMQKRVKSTIGSAEAPRSKQPEIDVRAFVADI